MQKIIIKNFRAIEYAEIELKKVLVLIGQQASGKSTIAKLIYFFKTIQDDFFVQVYESGDVDLEKLIRRKFIEFLGDNDLDFLIQFWFEKEKYCSIKYDKQNRFVVEQNFIIESDKVELKAAYDEMRVKYPSHFTKLVDERLGMRFNKKISNYLSSSFGEERKDSLYAIAGRNVTVTYSNIFTEYLKSKIQLGLGKNLESVAQKFDSTDERLMLNYIQRVNNIKRVFEINGKSFDGIIQKEKSWKGITSKKRNFDLLEKFKNQSNKILKSKYQIENDNENLILTNGKIVPLFDASSGQQEVIRILQDLFLITFYNYDFLRIIEEPEAHLFPIAQKELIELLALAVNYQRENQLIIATHSPYILSVFNNLLFANEVANKDENLKSEVAKVIDEDFWLSADDFRAYTLNGEEAYCESIMSEDGAMIDQNYLDEVSDILGMEFYALRELYRQTFKSKRR